MKHGGSQKQKYMIIAAVLFTVSLIVTYLYTSMDFYLSWILSASIVTFALYGFDKMMAIQKSGRVPEIVLHVISLIGGAVGGWLGMVVFRHKKNNITFIVILLLATIINLGSAYYFYPDIFYDFIQPLLTN